MSDKNPPRFFIGIVYRIPANAVINFKPYQMSGSFAEKSSDPENFFQSPANIRIAIVL